LRDGLSGERDRFLGSFREAEVGECDAKRVHLAIGILAGSLSEIAQRETGLS
jgi:hypothetical protein